MADQEQIIDSEELVEFKADGEASSIADPIATGSNKRKADKDQGDKAVPTMDTKDGPKMSKVQMINAMVGDKYAQLSRMTASDLRDLYNTDANTSKSRNADNTSVKMMSVKEDVAEMFGGQDIGEEFIEKAETIFEAAVGAKIVTEVARLEEEYEQKLQESAEQYSEQLTEQVDQYLSHVVAEWIEENRLAVESGIRADIAESFMAGLKSVFEEHYVELPEEKVDVVAEMAERVEELETELNETVEKNFALQQQYVQVEQLLAFEEIVEGLAETQAAKLRTLAEGIEADTVEQYKQKLNVIKENYFPTDKPVVTEESDDLSEEGLIEEEAKPVDGEMSAYLTAVSKSVKYK